MSLHVEQHRTPCAIPIVYAATVSTAGEHVVCHAPFTPLGKKRAAQRCGKIRSGRPATLWPAQVEHEIQQRHLRWLERRITQPAQLLRSAGKRVRTHEPAAHSQDGSALAVARGRSSDGSIPGDHSLAGQSVCSSTWSNVTDIAPGPDRPGRTVFGMGLPGPGRACAVCVPWLCRACAVLVPCSQI